MIVEVQTDTLVVRQGWTRVMRQVARKDIPTVPAKRQPAPLDPSLPLGPRIRYAREHAGWSQSDLARAIGMSRHSYNLIEMGHTQDPAVSWVKKIALTLHVSMDELCGLTQEED